MNLTFCITGRCNFQCSYCYYRQDEYRSDFSDRELPLEVIKEFYERNKDLIESVTLTGGEPFLHNDIKNIIELFSNKPLLILSNGSLINDKYIEIIKKHNIKINISMDQTSLEHSNLEGRDHHSVIENVGRMIEAGITNMTLCLTLCRNNIEQAKDVINYANSNNLGISIGLVDYNDDLTLLNDKDSYLDKVKEIYRLGYGINSAYYEYFVDYLFDSYGKERKCPSCSHSDNSLFIDYDGKLYNCFHDRKYLGDICNEISSKIDVIHETYKRTKSDYNCLRAACITLF